MTKLLMQLLCAMGWHQMSNPVPFSLTWDDLIGPPYVVEYTKNHCLFCGQVNVKEVYR